MIISLIFSIIFFILFVFFIIAGGNYMLRSMVDNVLAGKKEKFTNFKELNQVEDISINPIDACKQIDNVSLENLNFQTATNIPLSPYYYKNYVGEIYINNESKNNITSPNDDTYCLKKSKLLYDGIWDPSIKNNDGYEYENWNLTNGNLTDGYYCSNKLIEVNKPFPKNYVDKSATPPIVGGEYYTYFNDTQDDVFDTEIQCFPSVFNAGITEDLKKKFDVSYAMNDARF